LTGGERAELDLLRSTAGAAMLAQLGLDRVQVALTGAAPVPRDLVAFWMSLGLMLIEAWGLSEAGAFGAFNRPDRFRVGTVGGPLPGVEQRLLDDGEVLLRSPWLMRGYRNSPEKTAEAIDADGWLHTGDVGQLDADGFLSIIDRKKEIMINAAGKNMSPANIEAKVRDADSIVSHAVVIGEGRPYNAALIVLDGEAMRALGAANEVPDATYAELSAHPVTVQRVQAAVDRANAAMSRVEQIKKFMILPTEWAPASDELTPTMKLRRGSVNEKYAEQIESLYA
jgi:long-subunit acyl-CoA synthetase (AMP-forming)